MTSLRGTTLLLTLLVFSFVSPHHVVFEEIGKMAGALSYIHAIVLVNISGLAHAVNAFKEDVRTLENLYKEKRQPTGFIGYSHDDWFNQ